jgi:hypothetical protein
MKKLFYILMILLMSSTLSFGADAICPGACTGGGGGGSTSWVPTGAGEYKVPDSPAPACLNRCRGDRIGTIAYTGHNIDVIDYQTGEGYTCRQPENCGFEFFLCDCKKVDEILIHHPYQLVLFLETPGCKWATEASIYTPVIEVNAYKAKSDLCRCDEEPYNPAYTKNLSYWIDDSHNRVIITQPSRTLIQKDYLYLSIKLPKIVVDEELVPFGTPIKVSVGLYDGKQACNLCTDPICACARTVALMGCIDECCKTLNYLLGADSSWWCGLAITNRSHYDGAATITFIQGNQQETKLVAVPAGEISTFTPAMLGINWNGAFWCHIESSFDLGALGIIGNDQGSYGYQATSCAPCQ